MITRRDFLAGASAAAFATGATPARPNVLWLMVDEMRADAMGCAGHPMVKTPHLDKLAREGARFANAYTVSSVCTPSRASLFTGRYAHVHGAYENNVGANPGEIFLPSILKHYGYTTGIAGKLHFTPEQYSYGFDRFWSYKDEGPTPAEGYEAYLERKHGSEDKWPIVPGTCPFPKDVLGKDLGIFRYPEADFETNWLADRAVEFMTAQRGKAQPWFMFTSFTKPHSPSVEPERYYKMYDPAAVPVFKLPPNATEVRNSSKDRQWKRLHIDNVEIQRAMTAEYFGAITHVDDQVGRILGELDRLGMADNTLVIFTADHGNMLGQHGYWFKGVMYDGASRVPLILRPPRAQRGKAGHVENQVTESVDVFTTVLESAGISIPAGVQGTSLSGLMHGRERGWKNRVHSQTPHRNNAMVRAGRWKLIDNSLDLTGPAELYDMETDPAEERNLIAEAKHQKLIADLKESLKKWRAEKPPPIRIEGMPMPDYAQPRGPVKH